MNILSTIYTEDDLYVDMMEEAQYTEDDLLVDMKEKAQYTEDLLFDMVEEVQTQVRLYILLFCTKGLQKSCWQI